MPFDSTEKWTVRRRSQAWPGLETNLEVLNMVSKFLEAVNSQTIFVVVCIISSEPVRSAGVIPSISLCSEGGSGLSRDIRLGSLKNVQNHRIGSVSVVRHYSRQIIYTGSLYPLTAQGGFIPRRLQSTGKEEWQSIWFKGKQAVRAFLWFTWKVSYRCTWNFFFL